MRSEDGSLPTVASFPNVELLGMTLAATDASGLLTHIMDALDQGRGGWLVTANLDIVRRHVVDSDARALYSSADLRVADGMPLVWAAHVSGTPLPERVAGSSLAWDIARLARDRGRTLYLLGGDAGAAEAARAVLEKRFDGLRFTGTSSPRVQSPATVAEVDAIVDEISAEPPDILLVGLGSPKQEYLIQQLRTRFPRTWMIGVGITFSFIAGDVARAPVWMRRTGLEWVHRMAQDPERLVKRYLVHDLPFAARLFFDAARQRVSRRPRSLERRET